MSLSRAHRKIGGPTVGNTPNNIGPGSYVSKGEIGKSQDMRHAPFGSQAGRSQGSLYSTQKQSEWPSPNPAQYNVVDFYAPVIRPGGSSLANKSQRFSTEAAKAPDPGTYYQPTSLVKGKANPAQKRDGTVKIMRKPTPASVPARWENLGYAVDPTTGEATKTEGLLAPEKGVSPAAYSIKAEQVHGGTTFANRTAPRKLITSQGKQGPSPGDYHNNDSSGVNKSPGKRGVAVYGTATAMPQGPIVERPAPAPNSYTLSPKQFNPQNVPKQRQNFGTSQQRFQATDTDKEKINTPKPGSYEDPRKAINVNTFKHGHDRSPFNQSAARFPRSNPAKSTPGPQYNTESWQAGQSGLTQSLYSTINVASRSSFGSTERRKDPFEVRQQKAHQPAPWEYEQSSEPKRSSAKTRPSVNFKSKQTQRPNPSNMHTPAPSKYNTREDAHTHHRVVVAHKQVPFGTSKNRFENTTSVNAGRFTDMANPAPGQYQPPANTIPGGKILKKDRFSDPSTNTPGPNVYTLSSSHAHSTFKPTFNRTLSSKEHHF